MQNVKSYLDQFICQSLYKTTQLSHFIHIEEQIHIRLHISVQMFCGGRQ